MTTTLALFDTGAILGDLMKTHDATTCDVCHAKLVAKETYSICRFPDAPPNTRGLPEEHLGHTACKTCADDPCLYIGDGGACKPCLVALGNRRSAVKLAGVALRPPVKNGIADRMLEGFQEAQATIDKAQDQRECERLQEQDDRRIAAVEEKRRRKADEAEKEEARAVEEARQRREEEARALEEARQRRMEAEEAALAAEARRREEEAKAEEQSKKAEAAAAMLAAADDDTDARRSFSPAPTSTSAKKRKAAVVDEEVLFRRREQARRVREEKKSILADYPRLHTELEAAEQKLEDLLAIATSELAAAGTSYVSSFEARWKAVVASYEAEEEKKEEDGVAVD